ncbi:hypothetical protein CEXT_704471 [Caerostris extrusa]|uniref:Ribosomal protein S10 n=1 Tax=Caerostris extrusa TaxID=172846 RepID=A0AAV4NST3_CAEEX|nr:hypothetical protein CEXT_704471 [Caerostris extrusa]
MKCGLHIMFSNHCGSRSIYASVHVAKFGLSSVSGGQVKTIKIRTFQSLEDIKRVHSQWRNPTPLILQQDRITIAGVGRLRGFISQLHGFFSVPLALPPTLGRRFWNKAKRTLVLERVPFFFYFSLQVSETRTVHSVLERLFATTPLPPPNVNFLTFFFLLRLLPQVADSG